MNVGDVVRRRTERGASGICSYGPLMVVEYVRGMVVECAWPVPYASGLDMHRNSFETDQVIRMAAGEFHACPIRLYGERSPRRNLRHATVVLGGDGNVGEVKRIAVTVDEMFRGIKVGMIDSVGGVEDALKAGTRTRVLEFSLFGVSSLFPRLTSPFFLWFDLGSGVKMPTAVPGDEISVKVEFLENCSWYGVIEGETSAVLEKRIP